jgi:tocopherol O-methyltransferase
MAGRGARAAGVADRVDFSVHDANCLDPISDGFDLVWAIESTEHLIDKRAFIQSAWRLLDPGGRLALCAWLIPDRFGSAEHEELARGVCRGMLCPSLASMREYRGWMEEAGFGEIRIRDITRKVERTWDYCARVSRRREVQLLLRASDDQTRRFVGAFDLISRAYRDGAMRYGMLVGTRSEPGLSDRGVCGG